MNTADIVEITESATNYLHGLLQKNETANMGVRIFINKPGSYNAETCLAYAKPDEQKADDILQQEHPFKVWIDATSEPFLKDAKVDYDTDQLGGQLTIKAPNAKLPNIDSNSSVAEQIQYILQNEVNPMLASHGGMVNLVTLEDNETTAVLQFGGGCQGCGMADVTLKQGVEKTLLEKVVQLEKVRDVTDHTVTDNAYY